MLYNKIKLPLISIIIPTYNREYTLLFSIKSVLNQTYKNFELLVVDDGSEDDTESLVKKISDPRVRYIRHKKKLGANSARNTGIMASKGNYIAFNDSDDEWLPEKLMKQVLAMVFSGKTVKVAFSGLTRIRMNGNQYIPKKRY